MPQTPFLNKTTPHNRPCYAGSPSDTGSAACFVWWQKTGVQKTGDPTITTAPKQWYCNINVGATLAVAHFAATLPTATPLAMRL